MTPFAIAPELRRFIFTSVPSIPFLEALLLLHNDPQITWTNAAVAQRLYIGEHSAAALLAQLADAGMIEAAAIADAYIYQPRSAELRELIDQLAEDYSKHLIEISNLIHSRMDRNAHRCADAFKLRKDS
jgi:alpha-D-ribose 1-methylphosphonate 5-triphosphate diphosphatase PhnM